jgi:hypothetical protein
MDVRITPEPSAEEREALLTGLARLLAGDAPAPPPAYGRAWRRAALREGAGLDDAAERPTGWGSGG